MAGSVTSFIPFPQMPIADGRGMCTPEWYRYLNQPSFQSSDFPDKATSTDTLPEGTTNLYFTNLRAQDAVGSILKNSETITFNYVSGSSITASFTGTASNILVNAGLWQVLVGNSLQDALDRSDDVLLNEAATGVRYGMQLTINATNPAAVDVSAGEGQVMNNATPSSPTFSLVSFSGATGVAVANTSASITYWYVDATGTLQQTTTQFTPDDYRNKLVLGHTHFNAGAITLVNYYVNTVQHPIAQIGDLFNVLGAMTTDIYPYANGANLNMNISAGRLASYGANFYTDPQDPNFVSFAAKIPATFRYGTQTTAGTTNTTVIDVGNYDVGGTITPISGASTRATIHTVFLFPDGAIRVQYGQNVYASLAEARANLASRTFVVNPTYAADGHIIGAVIATKGATNLSDTTQALFIKANRFGEFSGGSGSISSVVSFNGRTGVVVPQSGDYALSQITSLARLWVMA